MQSNLSVTISVMKNMMNYDMCMKLGLDEEAPEFALDALLDVEAEAYQRGKDGAVIEDPEILSIYPEFKPEWDKAFHRGFQSWDMMTCSYCTDDNCVHCPIHD